MAWSCTRAAVSYLAAHTCIVSGSAAQGALTIYLYLHCVPREAHIDDFFRELCAVCGLKAWRQLYWAWSAVVMSVVLAWVRFGCWIG
jgi:hypothetical protein